MNLFDTAVLNVASLDRRVEALHATTTASERDRLDRFSERIVTEGEISLNMRLGTLLAFLTTAGRHQNIYEWAAARARRSALSEDEILRQKLGRFYAARRAFDDHFENGQQFRYGALNIGGAGQRTTATAVSLSPSRQQLGASPTCKPTVFRLT